MKAPDKIYVREFSAFQRSMQNIDGDTLGLAMIKQKTFEEVAYICREAIIKVIMDEREKCIQSVDKMLLTSLLEKINSL